MAMPFGFSKALQNWLLMGVLQQTHCWQILQFVVLSLMMNSLGCYYYLLPVMLPLKLSAADAVCPEQITGKSARQLHRTICFLFMIIFAKNLTKLIFLFI
jgi:hypothetical protein